LFKIALELFGGGDAAENLIVLPGFDEPRLKRISCLAQNAIRHSQIEHLHEKEAVPVVCLVFPLMPVRLLGEVGLKIGGLDPGEENALSRLEVAPEDFRDGFFGADGPAFVARAGGQKSLGHGIEGHIARVGIAGGQFANPLRQVVFGEFAVSGVQGVPEGLARYLLAAPVNLVFWMPVEVRGDRNKGAFCAFTHMLRV
jgi:hypothetical protein